MATRATVSKRKTVRKTSVVSKFTSQPISATPALFSLTKLLGNKKIKLGIIFAIVLLILLAFLFKSVFIAAMVNGEPISRLSVLQALEKQGGKATLEGMITKKLILQEVKKRNITITQSDIDSEIAKINTNLQSQGTTLDQALASQGMTKSDLNDEIRIQVAVKKLVGSNITLTEKEINDFVSANKAQLPTGTTETQFREQAISQLKQQKLQTKTQDFLKNLQDKAKITHFVSY